VGWLAKLPNTQAVVAAWIVALLATTGRVVAIGWEPSDRWLLFLTGVGTIATGGYAAKRLTDREYIERKEKAKK
jgi:hypothetical protein